MGSAPGPAPTPTRRYGRTKAIFIVKWGTRRAWKSAVYTRREVDWRGRFNKTLPRRRAIRGAWGAPVAEREAGGSPPRSPENRRSRRMTIVARGAAPKGIRSDFSSIPANSTRPAPQNTSVSRVRGQKGPGITPTSVSLTPTTARWTTPRGKAVRTQTPVGAEP